MVSLKTLIITIISAIAIMAGIYFFLNSRYNNLLNQVKKDMEAEKQFAIKKRDSLVQLSKTTINELKSKNENAKQQSLYWQQQARANAVNPDYDFDFITAAGIIANSEYKSGE